MILHFLLGKTPPLVTRVLGAKNISITNRSDSMVPASVHGDIDISDEPPPADKIAIGDIISFRRKPDDPKRLTRHRVVGIEEIDGEYHFLTKGDNNSKQDDGFRTHADIYDIVRRMVKFPPILQRFFQVVSDRQTLMWRSRNKA